MVCKRLKWFVPSGSRECFEKVKICNWSKSWPDIILIVGYSKVYHLVRLWYLFTSIRPDWLYLSGSNALAYFAEVSVMKKKRFVAIANSLASPWSSAWTASGAPSIPFVPVSSSLISFNFVSFHSISFHFVQFCFI